MTQELTQTLISPEEMIGFEIHNASGRVRHKVFNKLNVLEHMRKKVDNAIRKNRPIPVFNNLMPIVSSPEVLLTAYSNIKSNFGSMTPGTQKQTVDEFSMQRMENLSIRLRNGTYKFPDVRRKWLPKPGKNVDWTKKENLVEYGRPLGMPDFDAKVVQEATRMVFNAIYEPIFEKTNVSFGFRPNNGCQDTMSKIRPATQGMDIVIEGDIKGAFNNLQHDTLIKILRRRITDEKFFALIYDMCTAGIFDETQNIRTDSLIGVPQGAITSPILWNIYMHEFDRYILTDLAELINAINKKQKRTKSNYGSPQYKKAMAAMAKNKRIYNSLTKDRHTSLKDLSPEDRQKAINALAKYKVIKGISLKTPSKRMDKVPIRITYFRYADDWVLFTNAKPIVAKYLKNKIASFLKYTLGLTLSLEKTKITNLKKEEAKFLGFAIRKPNYPKIAYTKTGTIKRVTGQKIYIGIDKKRLLDRLEWRRYFLKGKPREQPAWAVLSDFEIIGKYNSVIRGLVNYYAPIISYKSTLNFYVYILEYSCYKTLCHKHRTTIRKLIKKYGFPLKAKFINKKGDDKTIHLLTCKTYRKELKDTIKTIEMNLQSKNRDQTTLASSDFLNNAKSFLRTSFKLGGRCVICGCKDHVEMHHIRQVRTYGGKGTTGFIRIMDLLNRKQIPVCRAHHKIIHDGKYDNISLSDLYDTRIAKVENYLKLY